MFQFVPLTLIVSGVLGMVYAQAVLNRTPKIRLGWLRPAVEDVSVRLNRTEDGLNRSIAVYTSQRGNR